MCIGLKNTLFAEKDKAICQWSVVSGQWSVVSGQWSVVSKRASFIVFGIQSFFAPTGGWRLATGP
jgi:hypothetical protein